MRPRAVVVQAQLAGHAVGAKQLGQAAPQHLALGVGRQLLGVAHAHGNLAGRQQPRHQQVVGTAHHQRHTGRLGAQATQQRRQQGELDIIGKADTKHRGAGGGVEVGGAADGGGDRIQRRREQGEDLAGPRGRLHAAPGAHEQRIVEQRAQAGEGGADRRLAEKEFFRCPRHAALVHQRLEHDEHVEIDAAQVVAVHAKHSIGNAAQGATRRRRRQGGRTLRTVVPSSLGMMTIDPRGWQGPDSPDRVRPISIHGEVADVPRDPLSPVRRCQRAAPGRVAYSATRSGRGAGAYPGTGRQLARRALAPEPGAGPAAATALRRWQRTGRRGRGGRPRRERLERRSAGG